LDEIFTVDGILGRGGMGAVYCVKNTKTEDRFAVKRVRPDLVRDTEHHRAFFRELHSWIAFPEHPHVVKCRFFRAFGDTIGIFADFVEGGSLQQWIDEGRLMALEQMLDVSIQTAWGLHAAHTWGLVHRDVKPGNFLMTPDGRALVTDFGLARARAQAGETADGATAGGSREPLVSFGGLTPAFCSPEQRRGAPLDRGTDVWSWGLSVLTLFHGTVNWERGAEANAFLDRYLETGPARPSLPPMPPAVVEVLRSCFRQEPGERWATLLDAADALRDIYAACVGRPYPRDLPGFPRPPKEGWTESDRWTIRCIQWDDPRIWLERALRAAGRDPREAERLMLDRTGPRAAQLVSDLAAYEEAARIYERLIGEGRQYLETDFATLCTSKALLHENLGDSGAALACYGRCIALYERLVSAVRWDLEPLLADAYMNKGSVLRSVGQDREALGYYDRCIAIRDRLVSEGRTQLEPHLALANMNKGNALQTQGEGREALGYYDRCIALYERLVSAGRTELEPYLATAYMNKGLAANSLGEGREALGLYDRCIALFERLVAAGRTELEPNLASAYINKGNALQTLGEGREALGLYDRCIAIHERLVAAGRTELEPDLAAAYMNKGNALRSLGQGREALGLYDPCIALFEWLVAAGRTELEPDLAAAYLNKAAALWSLGEGREALGLYDRCIAIHERLVAAGHTELEPYLATAYMNKAVALRSLGQGREALGYYDRCIAIRERLVAAGRTELEPDLARLYMTKGGALRSQGEYLDALGVYDRCIALLERLVSEGRTELEPDLANAYMTRGNAPGELEAFERMVAMGLTAFEPDLAAAYMNNGLALDILGEDREALGYYDRSIALFERRVAAGRTALRGDLARAQIYRAKLLLDTTQREQAIHKAHDAMQVLREEIARTGRGDLQGVLQLAEKTFRSLT